MRQPRTHCINGHPFEGDNIAWDGDKRICRTCRNQRGKETRARKPYKESAEETATKVLEVVGNRPLPLECDPQNGVMCGGCVPPHGTWPRYQRGCHCLPCTIDNRKHQNYKLFKQGRGPECLDGYQRPYLNTDWMADAACKNYEPAEGEPNVFFPEWGGRSTRNEAYAMCEECPVRAECLIWACHHADVGVWGGTGSKTRAFIRRRLGIREHLLEVAV